ncbi:unnamed protein product [Polarella glacialis]|uniref:Uncharacterized protein n=1 Tax=Polarella glacialis TaxID=89957 RepID=A0A813KZK0_POLGL|nr:unnamed protein product [Polarella glacialis]
MQDEVALVQTQKEEKKCKEQARIPNLDCQVPELVRCAGRGDLAGVRQLLDSGMDANIQDDLGVTALHCAAKKGHGEMVRLLLERRAEVDARAMNWKGETPVHYSCKYGHTRVLGLLLRFGANPAIRTQEGRTPLDYASEKEHLGCMELLMHSALSSCLTEIPFTMSL